MKYYKVPLLFLRKETNQISYNLIDTIIVKKGLLKTEEVATGYQNFYWLNKDSEQNLPEGDYLALLDDNKIEVSENSTKYYIIDFFASNWKDFYDNMMEQKPSTCILKKTKR